MAEVIASGEKVNRITKMQHIQDIGTGENYDQWGIYKPFDGRGLVKYFPDMGCAQNLTTLSRACITVCVRFFPSDVEVGTMSEFDKCQNKS